MLRWQSLALLLAISYAASVTLADISLGSKEPSDTLHQCRARAWVRAPDLTPGDVIAGDVKVKLIGPCLIAESYVLGLRYKEKIFWKLRRQDAPLPKVSKIKDELVEPNHDSFQFHAFGWTPNYNQTELEAYHKSFQNKDSYTVHEEERVAFEIKTTLVNAEMADPLPLSFIARFGILMPNTNYPPGLDYRYGGMMMCPMGGPDDISSESIYEYFIEVKFNNGITVEIPAGMTSFIPFDYLTKSNTTHDTVNMSLGNMHMYPIPMPPMPMPPMPDPARIRALQSNYTIEISFPGGSQVCQGLSVNMVAVIHRTGYTNRTDTPVELCAFLDVPSIEWHPQMLRNRFPSTKQFIDALVSSKHRSRMIPDFYPGPLPDCQDIKFPAVPTDLAGEGHISYTSSEPISLSLHVNHITVPGLSTYYYELHNRATLNLEVKPDPSESQEECRRGPWGTQEDMDESDFDWVPWPPRCFYQGDTSISVIPMQKQGHLLPIPIHYLSKEARQPVFVAFSDIAKLSLMSLEERDLIAPLAQPSMKVFPEGKQLRNRYFAGGPHGPGNMQQPVYVGDTWVNKVVAEGQLEWNDMDHFLVQVV